MDVTKFTRPRTEGDLIAVEFDKNYCRDTVTYLAGSGATREIPQFAVLGAILSGTPTVTAGAVISPNGGTPGNGAIGTVTASAGAQEGDYWIVFIEPTTNLGNFYVERPDGNTDGTGTVGTAYVGMINFTQADGSNDFVAGDRRKVTVDYADAGVFKHVQIDFTATNGAANAVGVAPRAISVPNGSDLEGPALKRGPLLLRSDELAWPAGATSDQKASALAQLQALGIVSRVSG